jgi:lipoprotein-anchoring transpeptidase ErfK/SrfK
MAKRITIDKSENRLRLYDGTKLIKTYPVATGRSTTITPEGRFAVVFKTKDPGWTNPDTGEFSPGGSPRNPLGTRWLGLGVGNTRGRDYGIHGTNRPSSIGGHITHGCVRMYNHDVEELYQIVPLGTIVTITK